MKIEGFEVGSFVRPADGHASGGDVAVARSCRDVLLMVVVDVLGHGADAHRVALRAESLIENTDAADPVKLLRLLDTELAGSPGAAVGLVGVRSGSGVFVGIGNTVARVFGKAERRLVSADGIVGQGRVAARPVEFAVAVGDVIILHSDGITSRFALTEYPSLPSEEVTTVARDLVRRFGRAYDDAACLVARRVE